MPTTTLTRAWTDLDFRAGLSAKELENLNHPSGDIDAELGELFAQQATMETTNCTKWTLKPPHKRCCC